MIFHCEVNVIILNTRLKPEGKVFVNNAKKAPYLLPFPLQKFRYSVHGLSILRFLRQRTFNLFSGVLNLVNNNNNNNKYHNLRQGNQLE